VEETTAAHTAVQEHAFDLTLGESQQPFWRRCPVESVVSGLKAASGPSVLVCTLSLKAEEYCLKVWVILGGGGGA
jgi:hypothetical protein